MSNIGRTLHERRQRLHISQQQLAASAGISQSCLSLYEKEKQEIPDAVLEKLCRTLDAEELSLRQVQKKKLEMDPDWTISAYLEAHKEEIIRRILQNAKQIRKFSLEELLDFEAKAGQLETELQNSCSRDDRETDPYRLFLGIPQLYSCSICKAEHGSCLYEKFSEAEEAGNTEKAESVRKNTESAAGQQVFCSSLARDYLKKQIMENRNHE